MKRADSRKDPGPSHALRLPTDKGRKDKASGLNPQGITIHTEKD
jgi:hypothetical protein